MVKKGSKYGKKKTTKDAYNSYKYKDKEESPLHVSSKEFLEIVKATSKEILKTLLDGEEVYLPSRLGSLQITKYKTTRDIVDYGSSNKYNTKIVHANLHSNGYMCKLHWTKNVLAKFKNKSMWAFDLTKDNKSRNDLSITRHIKKYGVHNFVEKINFRNG